MPDLNLNRRFIHVSRDDDGSTPTVDTSAGLLFGFHAVGTLGWSDLLRWPCAVVLGEAGTGKTTELRRQAAAVSVDGRPAFFVAVESVATRGLEGALDFRTVPRFREWMASSDGGGEAWFFLDSVDESKLKGLRLSDALNIFAGSLGDHLGRAHLVLSSRVSDWRSEDDVALACLRPHLAPSATSSPSTHENSSIVQLAPLDRNQVGRLATDAGLKDVRPFLGAVQDANAWSFVERPLDVRWMVAYWSQFKKLGSLTELLRFNIDEKLKDKGERPSHLTLARAKEGAARLAAIAILTRKTAFLLPGEPADPHAGDAIDPSIVLEEWTVQEIQDLLRRPLFDEATYGRVRIHHRMAMEYLAADHLRGMVRRGLPAEDLHALLFRESSGRVVVPPHLVAIAAWLSPDHRDVLQPAIACVPEQLLDVADPAALSPSDRTDALRAYAKRFGDRERVFHYFDGFGLQRFACAELHQTIAELLLSSSEPEHLKQTLLEIVRRGPVRGASEAALAMALAPSTPAGLRSDALDAIAAAGDDAQKRRVAVLLHDKRAADPEVAYSLIQVLYPTHLALGELLQFLATTVRPVDHQITLLDSFLRSLPPSLSSEERRSAFASLASLLIVATPKDGTRPEYEWHVARIHPNRRWLIDFFSTVVIGMLEDHSALPESFWEPLRILSAHRFVGEYGSDFQRLRDVLNRRPDVRRSLFWRYAAERRLETGKWPRRYWDVVRPFWIDIGEPDVEWLSGDAVGMSDVRDRLLAFDCLTQVLPRTPDYSDKLRAVARNDAALCLHMERFFNPPLLHRPEVLGRHDRLFELRSRREHEENFRFFQEHLDALRSGSHFGALLHLFHVGGGYDGERRERDVFLAKIEQRYDAEIAAAAREGFIQQWRGQDVPLPHEYELGRSPLLCSMELLGIGLDLDRGVDLRALPPHLLRRAIVLASWQLNNWPPWFERLSDSAPQIVEEVLRPSIEREYALEGELTGHVLYRLSTAPQSAQRVCSAVLLRLLRTSDPPRINTLIAVLESIGHREEFTRDLLVLARERAMEVDQDSVRNAVWWSFWLLREPLPAVEALVACLALFPRPEEHACAHAGCGEAPSGADQLVEEICARLYDELDEHKAQASSLLMKDVAALRILIPLLFTYVRSSDDVERPRRRAYSPGRRDHAQEIRGRALNWLLDASDLVVLEILEELVNEPRLWKVRDWLRHQADLRATADSARAPMTVVEALRFTRRLVWEPTSGTELFVIAKDRLSDIARDLAVGDYSVRQAYNPKAAPVLEVHAQNLVAHELQMRSREQYSVVREPELTRHLRPDIRILNARCGGPVTIELKIAERWTLDELRKGLTGQLVGSYMRAADSVFGIYLICSSGPKPGSKDGVEFAAVIDVLREDALTLLESKPALRGLMVFAIDFH